LNEKCFEKSNQSINLNETDTLLDWEQTIQNNQAG